MPTVVLLCTANMCRSVMAHAILAAEVKRRGLDASIHSAGIADYTGAPPAPDAWLTCLQHGVPMPKNGAEWFRNLRLSAPPDRVLAMERRHAEVAMTALWAPSAARISLLGECDPDSRRAVEIADPIGLSPADFEACFLRLRECVFRYLDTAEEWNAPAS